METNLYKPSRFFTITYLVTFVSWFISAYISYQPGGESIFFLFLLPGLVAPFCVALYMIRSSGSKKLWNTFKDRLTNLRLIKWSVFLPSLLITPEDLGGRRYAMDSLHDRFDYFTASLIFGLLWSGWHFPMIFVNGTYQNVIALENPWYAVNFMVSIIPLAFIISWICKSNRGSITAAVVLHFFINLSQEALNITQATKCIETGILALMAIGIVLLNKSLFFDKVNGKVIE